MSPAAVAQSREKSAAVTGAFFVATVIAAVRCSAPGAWGKKCQEAARSCSPVACERLKVAARQPQRA
eukprot:1561581-Prymnesium_polylepis.1